MTEAAKHEASPETLPAVRRVLAALAAVLALPLGLCAQEPALLTPGEANRWDSLSSHAEVTAFYRDLQARSPLVRTFHLGWSRETDPP